MTIPFLDLAPAYAELELELEAAILKSLRSGWYIGGADVGRFEQEFATYCGAKHCIGVANGLDALHLALRAMDIGPGDEVIVPSNTFIATWLAVDQCGATPIAVEPDPITHNLDPSKIEAALTPKTRCIIPVHLYGQPADLDAILAIAKAHGLRVLEDAAQAHGARYRGRRIGAHGDAVAWSFYPGKNLGALGDAGGITTDDDVLAERILALRNYGSRTKYVNDVRGYNSRLDPVQAAALSVKLRHIDDWNLRRHAIATRYLAALDAHPLTLPIVPDWAEPVWHLFVVKSHNREGLQKHLTDRGIGTQIHYPKPPHRQQAFADLNIPVGALPIAEALARTVLSLPIGPHLRVDQVDRVIDALLAWH